jgi:putative copper export protein
VYNLLLFLHVLSVIAGLGPTYALPGLMKLRGDPPSAAVLRAEAVISRYATIAVAVILVTGIGLISTSPYVKGQFGDAHWLHLGIALFVVLAGLGTGYAAPRMRKAVSAAESGDGAGVRKLLDPLDKVVGPILGGLGAVIVYLMLVKPNF